MGLVYLPTYTIKINHSCIGKYASPDPMGMGKLIESVFQVPFFPIKKLP